jgi:hypothetical protein
LLAAALPVAEAVPPVVAGALATGEVVLVVEATVLEVVALLPPLQATKPNDNTAAAKTTMVFLAMSQISNQKTLIYPSPLKL